MMISLLLSRVLGIIRDVIVAAMFGQNLETDAYRLSFQIPDLLFFLIAGGALSSAFIPVFSEYLHTDREDDAWHVFSAVVTIMSAIVLAFVVVAWIFAPQLAVLVAGSKPEEIRPLIAEMSRIVLPGQYAFFIGGLLFGTLYARQVFSVPGLGPNLYNLGIIFGAVVISQFVTPGVVGMSWGAVIGVFVGNLLIPIWVMRKLGAKFRPTFDTKHPGVRKVFRLMLPVILGLSLPGVYALILQQFGTTFAVGVNSALDNANKLMQAPLGVFGQSMAIGIFPALSQFFAQNDMDKFRAALSQTMRTVLFLAMPVALVMAILPGPIIQALLQHGKFTAEDTARTAAALQMFAIGIPAWCLHPVLMRAYFSVQRTVAPIVQGTATTLVFLALCFGALALGLPYQYLALAGSIAATALVVTMAVRIRGEIGAFDVRSVLVTAGKSLVAAALAAGSAWALLAGANALGLTASKVGFLVIFGVILLVSAWLYYFAAKMLKMPETSTISRALNRRRPSTETPSE